MNSVVVKNKFTSPVISQEEYKLKSSLFGNKVHSLQRKPKNVQRYYKN
jgi:hypothetical protein